MNPEIAEKIKNLERLESVLNSARLGIWDWYPQTNEVIFNQRWKQMIGYNMDELPNNLSSWSNAIHPDDKEETYQVLNDHMDGKNQYYTSEHRLKHKDGHYIWILDTGKIVERDSEGKPTRVTGIHQDITTRKELEKSLRIAKSKAEKANLSKSRFLANMSHDIRTPMNGILGAAQLLERTQLDVHQKNLIEMVTQSTSYLLTIINDILDFSKIEANEMILYQSEFDLKKLIKQIEDTFKPLVLSKGIEFQINLPHKHFYVTGDYNRLCQIIINLVSNAIKFTNQGSVQLSFQTDPAEGIKIIIEDTGIGMTPEFLTKIFTPFVQEDRSKAKNEIGTGLGTTIVKSLVDLMDGQIEVESQLNKGSKFIVKLPLKINSSLRQPLPQTSDNNLKTFHGHQVIVAEDNDINARVAKILLTELGIKMILASTGQEVLNYIEDDIDHSLILMDCQLPVMNGEQAAKILREQGYQKPIIAMTANVFPEDLQRYCEVGMNETIAKPF